MACGGDIVSRASATLGGHRDQGAWVTSAAVWRYARPTLRRRGRPGDGSAVSHREGLSRDNSGYHLPSLLAGSAGTLAIITHATVRLVPAARGRGVALIGFASAKAAVAAAAAARAPAEVQAVEFVLDAGIEVRARTVTDERPCRPCIPLTSFSRSPASR